MLSVDRIRVMRIGVGIGYSQTGQDANLECLHLVRVGIVFMIEAEQMQKAVNDEMFEMGGGFEALIARFRQHGFAREDDIAQAGRPIVPGRPAVRRGKRQDVGRLVLAAIRPVQEPDLIVRGERDTDGGRREFEAAEGSDGIDRRLNGVFGIGHKGPAVAVVMDDIGP